MKSFGFAALAAAGLYAVAAVPAAAETCPGALSANNPAFGTPRACAVAPLKPASKAASKTMPTTGRKADEVKTEGGRTVYRSDDTTIAVGGYIAADVTTGRTRLRP